MKRLTELASLTFLILIFPLSVIARSDIVTCPTLFEVHASEASGKQYYRWWTEDYRLYWRGSGVKLSRFSNRQRDLATTEITIDMNDDGFIHCDYKLDKKVLGSLQFAKSGRYCHFMGESYQEECHNDQRMCCNKPNSARCQVIMCSE
ncbi:MAG: hypothetical protein P1U40_01535 [Coxiellaceae bacterium]|nr:hypothetical protein [Coxiellaceae bacterium]